MDETVSSIEAEHSRMGRLWSEETGKESKDVRLEYLNNGYMFRIPNTNSEKSLRKMDGVRVSCILKNGVQFETKKLKRLDEEYRATLEEYEQTQRAGELPLFFFLFFLFFFFLLQASFLFILSFA